MMFFKMQGLGNDYVYIDCINGKEPIDIKNLTNRLSNRHFGVGSDGLILLCKSKVADLKMRMFNSDGSEAQMCGNGIRCVAKLAYELGLICEEITTIETLSGIKTLKLNIVNGKVKTVEVDMGAPILEATKIPVSSSAKIEDKKVKAEVKVKNKKIELTCVSMGNPHAVTFVNNIKNFKVAEYGPILENADIFPEKANIEFVEVVDKNNIKMRVWERGSGETLACGTGACSSVVASRLNGYTDRKVNVQLLGGNLEIEWKPNNHVHMTGPAVTVFKGEWIDE
ncbi:MAG: diaminopimelate epimerase [Clostridia bacterium]|mgnify:FL=1|jgi:diaminopimelate epimerase|nr:diaminopimelate epimerase [Clostridia bacterium]